MYELMDLDKTTARDPNQRGCGTDPSDKVPSKVPSKYTICG